MNKLHHLESAIAIFARASPRGLKENLRSKYEQALQRQKWTLIGNYPYSSEWGKDKKRMNVKNGDHVLISFDGITWHALNTSARQKLLLHSQAL